MFREMRRKDKAKTREEAWDILCRVGYGTVAALLEDGYPYAVPVSYVCEGDAIYFHSANEGQKYEAFLKNPKVCFTVVEKDEPQPGKFTTFYRSAIAFGAIRLVEDEEEMKRALRWIVQKYDPDVSRETFDTYTQAAWGRFCVFEIKIKHLTAKGLA